MTQKAASAGFCVAPATAHRWRLVDEEQRSTGGWLLDRSSRPHRQPRRLTAAEEEPTLEARRQANLCSGRLAGASRSRGPTRGLSIEEYRSLTGDQGCW